MAAVLPGPYRVAEMAATCVAMATTAAHSLLSVRGGRPTPFTVHIGHAAEAFRSERHTRVVGEAPRPLWAPLSGDYRAADGWVRLHGNYPHHAAAIRRALGADPTPEVARRPAVEVEDVVLAEGGAAGAMRTREDWLTTGPGAAIREEPLVARELLGDASPAPLAPADVPLAGVRVLDLTHVIAGPVCGRVLAAHGADVLHVTPPQWPVLLDLVRDTDFGKRQCIADLGDELRALVAGADVVIESFRPESLARKGFGPADLAVMRPGVIVVSIDAYGHTGPWRSRRGFDSIVQMSCGIAAHAGLDRPRPLPAQALDHGTGWLAAQAVMTALRRRATEGGSWHLRLSLARTGEWLHDLGRQDDGDVAEVDPTPWLTETASDFGRLTHLRVPHASVDLPGPRKPGRDPATWW
ncbi:CoA transferase [Actinophytocola oryzae]|uniref:CoA transferase family III n=1 Tax=Actinophytocola oryzae TaxID=502181 RepID=A0A4R7VZ19_9PSEU|nr:CoA transferase [Actinophytocola oryzae]TDV55436.1 CoA transferase family III [Actinophytocola oryzae]